MKIKVPKHSSGSIQTEVSWHLFVYRAKDENTLYRGPRRGLLNLQHKYTILVHWIKYVYEA